MTIICAPLALCTSPRALSSPTAAQCNCDWEPYAGVEQAPSAAVESRAIAAPRGGEDRSRIFACHIPLSRNSHQLACTRAFSPD